MTEYKVSSEGRKHFRLTKDHKEIGSLDYKKWSVFKAEMILNGSKIYQIEPKGFWRSTMELKQYGKVLLSFKMNWKGMIIIKTRFDEREKDFIFRHKGVFKSLWILLDKEGQELLQIHSDFKWRKFSFDYTISSTDSFERLSFRDILLITVVHCVNYYLTRMSGA